MTVSLSRNSACKNTRVFVHYTAQKMKFFTEDFFSKCDKKPYVTAETLEDFIETLEEDSITLFEWLMENHFKENIGKSHLNIILVEKINLQ